MNIREHNRQAWNREVKKGNKWTVPANSKTITEARRGKWSILLTPQKPVPQDWFPDVKGLDVLCLASGGGQQAPVLAAAGAKVTVLDNSDLQLSRDRMVAQRENLDINILQGDMADLSIFPDECFSLIVHPVSNNFVKDVLPVWKEAYRVLRHGGTLLSGFLNPHVYLFDFSSAEKTGIFTVKYTLPYADIDHPEELESRLASGEPVEFSHTLEELIGGQINAGFIITGFYEDTVQADGTEPIGEYLPECLATRAEKP